MRFQENRSIYEINWNKKHKSKQRAEYNNCNTEEKNGMTRMNLQEWNIKR